MLPLGVIQVLYDEPTGRLALVFELMVKPSGAELKEAPL